MNLSKSLSENIDEIKKILPVDKSFDIVGRYLDIGSVRAYILFIDGFAKDDIMVHVLKELQGVKPEDSVSAEGLILKEIPYIETATETDIEKTVAAVLTGQVALIFDGGERAVLIDVREYPSREPSESHIEKVTRGPRDDLVETLVFNTALIRRRVRDFGLTFEIATVGSMSKTDVAIGYIGSKVDKKLLGKLRDKLADIKVDALTMGEKSLEEVLVKKRWYNPLPQFRVSERPDTIAAHLMEGHIVLLVDTSPTALILPSTFFYFTQYVEDYYQNAPVGTLTRLIRFAAILAALLLVPMYLLMNMYPDATPQMFRALIPNESAELSVFMQIIVLELGLEVLRLSSLHTPQNIQSAFSIIGGLILGDFAVTMGLFIGDSIFYTVASAIAGHCIPNPELGNAIKVFRWFSIVLTGIFGIWGFLASLVIILFIIGSTKTFDDRYHYLWPLIPFNFKALKHLIIRYPLGELEHGDKDK